MRNVLAVVAGCAAVLAVKPASALVINYDYSGLGTVYDKAGELSDSAGAGFVDVTAAFKADAAAAATIWQRALFGIPQTLTVAVTLANLDFESAVGDSLITSDDTAPNLPSSSNIRVNESPGTLIYVAANPFDNSAFNLNFSTTNLNGNVVNVSRFGTAVSGGPADGQYDLVTLFLHELEHSLGFTYDPGSNYANLFDASSAGSCSGTPAAGTDGQLAVSPLVTGSATGFNIPIPCSDKSHIDGVVSNGLFNDTTVAAPGFGVNQRALITGVEILGLCAADGGTAAQCDPNPSFAASTSSVPEPASLWLLASAIPMLLLSMRLRKNGRV